MRNFFTTCFFLIASLNFSIAQDDLYAPGTWITSDGDTVSGYIKDNISKGRIIYVKLTNDEKPVQKNAGEIDKVYQNDLLTISSYSVLNNGKKEKIFLELLSQGVDISLFKGKDVRLGHIYAIYKREQFVLLNKADLASSYQFLYGNCQSIDFRKKYAFTQSSIIDIFKQYNFCLGNEIVEEENPRKKKKIEIFVGPKLGYTLGNFIHSEKGYFANGDYSMISSPKIGVAGQVKFSKRWNIQMDFTYLKKKSSSDSVNTPPIYLDPDIYSNFVEYDLTFIDWQFYVNYAFIDRTKFSAAIGFGLIYGFLIDSEFTQEANGYGLGEKGPPFVDFSGSNEAGLLASLGATYYTNNKNQIQFNLMFNITDMDYIVHRDSDDIGGYGGGSNSLNSKMIEVALCYLFKVN